MPVTQKDIARIVGVSQTVVSDVLQDRERARVNGATRQRILQAARELGYRPNAFARSLRTQRSHQIAYVLARSRVRSGYTLGEQALGALAGTLAEQEYQLNLRVIPDHGSAAERLTELFALRQCDGCVVRVAQIEHWNWQELQNLSFPILYLGHCPDGFSSLAIDTDASIRTILHHLTARGHRQIAFLAAEEPVDFYRLMQAAWERLSVAFGVTGPVENVEERRDAAARVREWKDSKVVSRPTAFVCARSISALGVTDTLLEFGATLGSSTADVVMLGKPVFGEDTRTALFPSGVWYLNHDQNRVGELAAETILHLVRGNPSPGAVRISPPLVQIP